MEKLVLLTIVLAAISVVQGFVIDPFFGGYGGLHGFGIGGFGGFGYGGYGLGGVIGASPLGGVVGAPPLGGVIGAPPLLHHGHHEPFVQPISIQVF